MHTLVSVFLVQSLLPKDTLYRIFDFTTAGDWDCVAAVECHPALHYNGFNKNEHTAALFIDIEKAYDSVWRDGLMMKFKEMGITGKIWT